jgi:hypothetical protein
MQVDQLKGSELMHWVHQADLVDPKEPVAEQMRIFPAAGRYDHIVSPGIEPHSEKWNEAVRAYIKSKLGPEVA